LRKSFPLCPTG